MAAAKYKSNFEQIVFDGFQILGKQMGDQHYNYLKIIKEGLVNYNKINAKVES